jgi:hypothetical protein
MDQTCQVMRDYCQQQALNAIVFLYRRVLDQPIEDQLEPVKAKRQIHLPMLSVAA